MKNTIKTLFDSLIFILLPIFTFAQLTNNQHEFEDKTNRSHSTVYRTASGYPGPAYFQNRTDYKIKLDINAETHILSATVVIDYTNYSPHALEYLWLNLEQNRFTPNSRGTLTTPIKGNRYNGSIDGGYQIKHVMVNGKEMSKPDYTISDTRMQVLLPTALPPNSGQIQLSISYSFKIPEKGMDRLCRMDTKNGTVYAIAQWFPQMAVYDDIKGWNIEPYLGAGEFYTDYGDYEVEITVPYNYIVVASGSLQNPKEVLSKKIYANYIKAHKSEKTTSIISEKDINNPKTYLKKEGTSTWKYSIKNARDFAFSTSNAFIWDGAKINLPEGKTSFAHSVYPIESEGETAWSRSTEYVKASVEYYSKMWYPYPYPEAVNVAAEINGMEYPGLSFCHWKDTKADLWGVTDHEFGHNWFPMIVGSNERLYPWMDEGFNTFINHYSTQAFNNNEYPTRIDKPSVLTPYFLFDSREGIHTYPDVVQTSNLGVTAYFKPAIGLRMLREYVLGEARFDQAFRSYIKTWAYKHPHPFDFFNHMENVSGENLSWFWNNWFLGNDNIDIAITDVSKEVSNYKIKIENKGEMPMPVKMKFEYSDNSSEVKSLPVEIWQRGNVWQFLHPTNKDIIKITIDPKFITADVNFLNNQWKKDTE